MEGAAAVKGSQRSAFCGRRALFLVWNVPGRGSRSRVFAEMLGIDLLYVYSTTRRGLWVAPWKYGYQAVVTLWKLFTRRPRVIFVQSPPGFAVMFSHLYCAVTGARFITDAHTAAIDCGWWSRPERLYRWLARKALLTIVTNDVHAERIRSWNAHAVVIPDIPTTFDTTVDYPLDSGVFNIAVVSTFSPDEPLDAMIDAVRDLDGVVLHVTGSPPGAATVAGTPMPPNVRMTGYLPDTTYFGLLDRCDAVMCLTTRDNTMQNGACEALSLGTPVITSRWQVLTDYFRQGAVAVDNDAADIKQGILRMIAGHDRYRREIVDLQHEQRATWERGLRGLVSQVTAGD